MKTHLGLVIYDGDCRFCRFGIEVIARLDRRGVFEFCPFGHRFAERALVSLPPNERHAQMHLATSTGLKSGTEAARAILSELPLGRFAVAVCLHRLYPLIVRYRWALGRLVRERAAVVTCGKPPPRGVAFNRN